MKGAISRHSAGWINRLFAIQIAQHKAYTALFGIPTQDFFNFIQGDPSILAGIPTLARVAYGGGFPIKPQLWKSDRLGRPENVLERAGGWK